MPPVSSFLRAEDWKAGEGVGFLSFFPPVVVCLDQWFLSRTLLPCRGFGNVWRRLGLSYLGDRVGCYWHPVGGGQGTVKCALRHQDALDTE